MPSKEPAKLLIASIDAVATCSLLENTKKKCNQEYKQETALKIFIKKNEKIHKNMTSKVLLVVILTSKRVFLTSNRQEQNEMSSFWGIIDPIPQKIDESTSQTWQ